MRIKYIQNLNPKQAMDYDASIAGWGFWSYECYVLTSEVRNNNMWVGPFLLDEEWFDSCDRSLASERCISVLGRFDVDATISMVYVCAHQYRRISREDAINSMDRSSTKGSNSSVTHLDLQAQMKVNQRSRMTGVGFILVVTAISGVINALLLTSTLLQSDAHEYPVKRALHEFIDS